MHKVGQENVREEVRQQRSLLDSRLPGCFKRLLINTRTVLARRTGLRRGLIIENSD